MDTVPEDIMEILLRPVQRKSPDEVHYHIFAVDDPHYQRVRDDGSTEPDGFQLGLLRKLLGGEESEVRGPLNDIYPVSLKPWKDANPETTYLKIEVPPLKSSQFNRRRPITSDEGMEYELHIEVRHAGDPDLLYFVLATGQLMTKGASLRKMRKQLGGDEGYIDGIDGGKQFVSLKPWANDDPDLTFVQFNWIHKSVEQRSF